MMDMVGADGRPMDLVEATVGKKELDIAGIEKEAGRSLVETRNQQP